MKRYLTNKIFVFYAVTLLFSFSVNAQERDPFSPSGSIINTIKQTAGLEEPPAEPGKDPLTSNNISGYKVSGVIVSENKKVAAIKTFSGSTYIVKVGDSIGSEGGKVTDITINGITVQTESETVKIPVSNPVEVPLDKDN